MEKKFWIYSIIVILILLAVIFVPLSTTPYFGLVDSGVEKISIGAIIPLTGSLGYQGEDIMKGLDLATEEINLNGGIKGHKVEIIYEDYGFDFKQAVQAYQKLTAVDNVKIIIPSYGDVVLAIAPLAEKDKVISFAVASASPKISNAGDFTFRNNLQTKDEVKVMADFIYNVKKETEVSGVVINTESGNTYFDAFKKEFESLGGKIKLVEKINKGDSDFKIAILKLKDNSVKNIFVMLGVEEFGAFLNQANQQGYSPNIYSGYFLENNKLVEIAGENIEGIVYTHFYSSEIQSAKNFKEKFVTKYGSEPNPFAVLAYENLYMLKEAIEKCANVSNSACIKDNLYKVELDSVTGKTTFDKNGDAIKSILLKTVKDGKFVMLEK